MSDVHELITVIITRLTDNLNGYQKFQINKPKLK